LEEVELPPLVAGQVLVEVRGVGFCHTDLIGRSGLLGDQFLPAVLGHEGSGVVEAVGPGVVDLAVGDHVVLTFDSCGRCRVCRSGAPAYCVSFEQRNLSGLGDGTSAAATDGGGRRLTSRWFGQSSFARHAITSERNTVRVDKDVPIELLGPLGCGVQTGAGVVLNAMRLAPGQSVAVFGVGAVGLAAVMAAAVSGACEIVAVEVNESRRHLALELGATRAVDGNEADLVAAVRGCGAGFDFSVDTTGLGQVMAVAVRVLGRPGRCVLVGAGTDTITVFPSELAGRELTYVYEGSAVPQEFIPHLVRLWRSGRFPFDRLIRQYPLDDIDRAEADAVEGRTVKPVLIPSPDGTPGARLPGS